MKKFLKHGSSQHGRWLAGLVVATLGFAQVCQGAEPQWWTDRGVKVSGAVASNYAMANQGQAKWFALQAEAELRAKLPSPYNGPVYSSALPPGNNYMPINQGQFKNLIKPLYDRLQQAITGETDATRKNALIAARPQGSASTYPWTDTTSDDQSYAPVNLAQLKYALSFNFDYDNNGLPDWWEIQNFGHSGVNCLADPDGDNLNNQQEYCAGSNPNLFSTDGTGMSDGWEMQYFGHIGINPQADPDADGFSNLVEANVTHTSPLAYDSVQPALPIGQGVSDSDRKLMGRQGGGGMLPQDGLPTELWFELIGANASGLKFSIHNTIPGKGYLLFSWDNPGKWIIEQRFTGQAGQNSTQIDFKFWGRSFNLFECGTTDDLDANGLPDSWEKLIAHVTIGGGTTADGDLDGDGVNNLDEYLLGRSPISFGTLPDAAGDFIKLNLF